MLVIMAGLGLAACGGDGDDGDGGSGATTTLPTSAPTSADPPTTTVAEVEVTVSSAAFGEGEPIPVLYTCDGSNTRPPLEWSAEVEGADSVAIVVDDPDAPGGSFIHWIAYGFARSGSLAEDAALPDGVTEAPTSVGQPGWVGPCPPSGEHRYQFHVYAISGTPDVVPGAEPADTWAAIEAIAVADQTLTGTYASEA